MDILDIIIFNDQTTRDPDTEELESMHIFCSRKAWYGKRLKERIS